MHDGEQRKRGMEKDFVEKGGLRERMTWVRLERRDQQRS